MEHQPVIRMAAWIPLLDPIAFFHDWWYLLIVPLAFGISVIYRALKLPSLDHYWRAVLTMTVQIVVVMAALAIGLVLWVQVVNPWLPVGD